MRILDDAFLAQHNDKGEHKHCTNRFTFLYKRIETIERDVRDARDARNARKCMEMHEGVLHRIVLARDEMAKL